MLTDYSRNILAYLSGLLGFMLVVVGMFVIFSYALVSLYQLFNSEKKWDEVRKQFSRKVLVGLDFVIAAHVVFVSGTQDMQALSSLALLSVVRVLLGYAAVKEAKI